MGCGEDVVARCVNQGRLVLGVIAPKEKHHALAPVGYGADDAVGELLPADAGVRRRSRRYHGQYRVEHQHALARPFLEIRVAGHPDSAIALDFLEDVLERGWRSDAFRYGK